MNAFLRRPMPFNSSVWSPTLIESASATSWSSPARAVRGSVRRHMSARVGFLFITLSYFSIVIRMRPCADSGVQVAHTTLTFRLVGACEPGEQHLPGFLE